jgi:mannose-1-phosphate guanylyltransferase
MTQAENSENVAVVIMAGGSGTRLWPLSRKSNPKQFQAFLSEKTLLEETYDRAKRLVSPDRIFVSTGIEHQTRVLDLLPDLSEDQLLLEPALRNTGPAIGLVATLVEQRFPGATIATIASDHAIENEDAFETSLRLALETVSTHRDKLCIVGINPTKPDTGLGYIQIGEPLESRRKEDQIYFVDAFKEKPDRETAESYLKDKTHLWNAGYFIFSAESMLGWIGEYAPDLSRILTDITEGADLDSTYEKAKNEPIDTMLTEKLPPESRIVVPAPIRWSDIGTWKSLFEFLSHKHGKKSFGFGRTIEMEGTGNLVYGSEKRMVALFGVEDLVVVDTDDVLFVTRRDRASDVKRLIVKLKEDGHEELL